MKIRFLLALMLTLGILSLALPQTALAGDVLHFRGQSAFAFFSNVDEAGIQTDVFIFASDDIFREPAQPPDSSSGVFVGISQFDTNCPPFRAGCPPPLLDAFGFASLDPSAFQTDKELTAATLNATAEVFDSVSGTSFDVSIDLDWTGTGNLGRGNDHFHFQSEGFIVNGHSNRTFRQAVASGSISYGDTNFTPQPSRFAEIESVKSGTVFID